MANIDKGDLKIIGEALTKLREARGISQKQLAAKSGVAQGTISRIESGYSFNIDQLLVLLKVLDCAYGDFFVDAGFTKEEDKLNEYKFVITLKAKQVRAIRGDVSGPGLKRAANKG